MLDVTYLDPVEWVTQVLVHKTVSTRKRRWETVQTAVRRTVCTATFAMEERRVLIDTFVHQDPVSELVLVWQPLFKHRLSVSLSTNIREERKINKRTETERLGPFRAFLAVAAGPSSGAGGGDSGVWKG